MKCGTVTVGVHWSVRKKIEDAISVCLRMKNTIR